MKREEILNLDYISAKELKMLVPGWGINSIAKFINEVQADMKEKRLYIPTSKSKLVLTSLVCKKLGIKR